MVWPLWIALLVVGVAMIVWGAENFAEHLSTAAARLGVGAFALALLLAGAEPEELETVVAAAVRDAPGIAFGDIIGSNIVHISISTVKTHVANIMQKIGARNRVEVAIWAYETGRIRS